jgi:protein-tyrosine phosphatase
MVSLLSDAETTELDLIHEADAAQAAGIEFHRLPTPDRQVPDRGATLTLGRLLLQRLNDGASVAVHCRYGIGRSSTLAAAVLVLEGTAAADAWDRVSEARGLPVPDTAEQREFINTLALT